MSNNLGLQRDPWGTPQVQIVLFRYSNIGANANKKCNGFCQMDRDMSTIFRKYDCKRFKNSMKPFESAVDLLHRLNSVLRQVWSSLKDSTVKYLSKQLLINCLSTVKYITVICKHKLVYLPGHFQMHQCLSGFLMLQCCGHRGTKSDCLTQLHVVI